MLAMPGRRLPRVYDLAIPMPYFPPRREAFSVMHDKEFQQ